jgi:hypothetical protein
VSLEFGLVALEMEYNPPSLLLSLQVCDNSARSNVLMLGYLVMQNVSCHGNMKQVTQQKHCTLRTKLYSNDNFIYLCLFNDVFVAQIIQCRMIRLIHE